MSVIYNFSASEKRITKVDLPDGLNGIIITNLILTVFLYLIMYIIMYSLIWMLIKILLG